MTPKTKKTALSIPFAEWLQYLFNRSNSSAVHSPAFSNKKRNRDLARSKTAVSNIRRSQTAATTNG
jgi:hypothetical protein